MESGWVSDLAFSYLCDIFVVHRGTVVYTCVLMSRNLTTIEHVGVSRMQGKERVLVERWFGMQSRQNKTSSGGGGRGKGVMGLDLKAKRKMVKEWDFEWGSPTKEGNRWWLGSSDEANYPSSQADAQRKEKERIRSRSTGTRKTTFLIQKEKQQSWTKGKKKGAWRTNIEQALGSQVWMWVIPIGKHPMRDWTSR